MLCLFCFKVFSLPEYVISIMQFLVEIIKKNNLTLDLQLFVRF